MCVFWEKYISSYYNKKIDITAKFTLTDFITRKNPIKNIGFCDMKFSIITMIYSHKLYLYIELHCEPLKMVVFTKYAFFIHDR